MICYVPNHLKKDLCRNQLHAHLWGNFRWGERGLLTVTKIIIYTINGRCASWCDRLTREFVSWWVGGEFFLLLSVRRRRCVSEYHNRNYKLYLLGHVCNMCIMVFFWTYFYFYRILWIYKLSILGHKIKRCFSLLL